MKKDYIVLSRYGTLYIVPYYHDNMLYCHIVVHTVAIKIPIFHDAVSAMNPETRLPAKHRVREWMLAIPSLRCSRHSLPCVSGMLALSKCQKRLPDCNLFLVSWEIISGIVMRIIKKSSNAGKQGSTEDFEVLYKSCGSTCTHQGLKAK